MNADVNIVLTSTQRQLARYAAVGFASNFALYCIYILLTTVSLRPHTAMTITYAAGLLVTFLLNRNWTFSYPGIEKAAFFRYVLVYAVGYAVNFLLLYILVDYLGYPHEIVQACLILALAIALFLGHKNWVFDETKLSSSSLNACESVGRTEE